MFVNVYRHLDVYKCIFVIGVGVPRRRTPINIYIRITDLYKAINLYKQKHT